MKRIKNTTEEAEVGFYVPLIDVFTLLNKFFESDQNIGIKIMHKLLPSIEDPSRKDFLMYNIAAKMTRLGKSV